MPIKLKKSIYIGLGGTGVSVLLKVKKCFIDSYGEIPPMIGFLAIDTDGTASNKSETSNKGETIRLDPNELLVCTVRGALPVYQANPRIYDWVPANNVEKLSSIAGYGAGQVRSNGRFIAYYNNERIKNNIQAVVTKIHQLIPQGSTYEVDYHKDGVEYAANINVFASVAGGTGSGMLVDVLAIIREALKQSAQSFKLYPWIVLPEIFRAMNQGPSMANVLYNSYGAIRTLDYIIHHNPDTPAINFGYTRINESLFDIAFIINNVNRAGVSFNKIDDIIDVVAKSSFLPANKMGDDISSPFDNIIVQQKAGTYDIKNKKAWAASASSAELIYDGMAVGRARAYTIINQLCDSMLQCPTDGSNDANKFFDDQNVMIRENNGRDDIIDTLLSPAPEYSLQIDENTTELDINSYIDNNCGQIFLEPKIKEALDKKLANTSKHFESYIEHIMARQQGKVDAAIKFIKALLAISAICKQEMEKECDEFHNLNSIPVQWNVFVNAVKNKGIKYLLARTNETAIEDLQNKLNETVTNNREEIRRSWAIKFYNSFDEILNNKLQKVESLKAYLLQISGENTRKLLAEQQQASSRSTFRISLHEEDVRISSKMNIDDAIKSDFVTYLGDKGVASWIGQSISYIENKLWNFAKGTSIVQKAVDKNIDNVLQSLPVETVKAYLDHLKILASPLWTYNTQGFNDKEFQLDRFVVVGVGNRDTSIISKDPIFNTHFNTNEHVATFASTNQYDRVYVLVVEDLLPIYAVNNFSSYQRDNDEKVSRHFMTANYIDEKLNSRINSENFSVIPADEPDNVLQYWVWGFIFGYIHFDNDSGEYWIRSRQMGDPIRGYRYNLNAHRDVAYDIFRSESLYREVETALNAEIARTGRQPIDDSLRNIKDAESYMEVYAQLNPLERSNIDDPNFRSIRELLGKEIQLMTW